MPRRVPLLAALALTLAAALAAPGPGRAAFLTDVDEAVTAARASGRPILVDLYADWCTWCKRLDKEVFSSEIFSTVAPRFVLLRVDTEDGGQGTALAERFGVVSLPTTLVMTADRAKVAEVKGFAPADSYIGRIQAELARFAELERAVRAAAGSRDPDELLELADALHERRDPRAALFYQHLLELPEAAGDNRRLRFLLADALRLGGRFEEARSVAETLRADVPDGPLAEQIDLLRFRIARDRGSCDDAIGALETFLATYPDSALRGYASQTLDHLRSDGGASCT